MSRTIGKHLDYETGQIHEQLDIAGGLSRSEKIPRVTLGPRGEVDRLVDFYEATGKAGATLSMTPKQASRCFRRKAGEPLVYRGHPVVIVEEED